MSATNPEMLRAFAQTIRSDADPESPVLGEKSLGRSIRKALKPVSRESRAKPMKRMRGRKTAESNRAKSLEHGLKVAKAGGEKIAGTNRLSYIVQPSCVGKAMWLCLQAQFCRNNGLLHNTLVDLTVQGVVGKRWEADYVYQDQHYVRRALMYSGFRAFVRDNRLQEGDRLILELLRDSPRPWFRVLIERRASPLSVSRAGRPLAQPGSISNTSLALRDPSTERSTEPRNSSDSARMEGSPVKVQLFKLTWEKRVLIECLLEYY